MTDATSTDVEALKAKIRELEERLAQTESDDDRSDDSKSTMDNATRMMDDSRKLLRSVMEVSVDAMGDVVNAVNSFVDETGTPSPDKLPDAMFRALHKMIDVQNKTLERVEERFKES